MNALERVKQNFEGDDLQYAIITLAQNHSERMAIHAAAEYDKLIAENAALKTQNAELRNALFYAAALLDTDSGPVFQQAFDNIAEAMRKAEAAAK